MESICIFRDHSHNDYRKYHINIMANENVAYGHIVCQNKIYSEHNSSSLSNASNSN